MGEAKQIPDEAPVAENANPQFTSVDLKVDDVPKDLEKGSTVPSDNVPVEGEAPVEPPKDPAKALVDKLMMVLLVSSGLAIFLWFMAGAGFPWFIYVVYGVGLVDLLVYSIKQKKWFFLDWSFYASTNAMLFLTFLACGGGYPWFIIPAFSMAIIPVCHYIAIHYQGAVKWLYIHAAIYFLINIMIFFIWIANSLHTHFPWFIYPWSGWGVLLLIQYNYAVLHDKSKTFVFICADLGIMLMITFRFAIGPIFLVFLFIAIFAIAVYYFFLRKKYEINCGCMRLRKKQPEAPKQPEAQSAQPQPQAPLPTTYVNVPANIPQLAPQQYQAMPAHPMFYPNPQQQQMYFQPAANGNGPVYYAYFPSNGQQQLYPPLYGTSGTQSPASPIPVPNSAVLATEQVKDEEEERLLRSSPPLKK